MPTFDISAKAEGIYDSLRLDGTVELDDEEVSQLVDLIRRNNGETDVEKLCLKEALPSIYEELYDAYYELTRLTAYRLWLQEGYEGGYFEEREGIIDRCKESFGFEFEADPDDEEYDEDAEREAFEEWENEYYDSLSDEDKDAFIETCYECDDYLGDFCVDVEIPNEIVLMAKEKEK